MAKANVAGKARQPPQRGARRPGSEPSTSPAEHPAQPRLRVKVVLYPDGAGGYTVVVPALPGCITEGDSRAEALANLREALQGYLLSTSGIFEMEEGGIEEEIEF